MRLSNIHKAAIIALVWLTATTASAFSIKEWRDSLLTQIKTEAKKSFSELLRREIRIDSVGGPILGQIVLNNLVIPELGKVQKVTLDYNLIKYIATKGDFNASLSKITLENADLKIERKHDGSFNFSYLMKVEGPTPSPPPALPDKIVLINSRATYIDQIGFRPVPQRFEAIAENINGSIDLHVKDKLSFAATANLPEKLKISGAVNLKKGNYEINVSAERLNLEKWANYTVPLPDLTARGGTADVFLKLSPPRTKGWPVALDGKYTFYQGACKFQSYEITNLSGKLAMVDEDLNLSDLISEINGAAATANGSFRNFVQQKLDLNLDLTETRIEKLSFIIPQIKNLDLVGSLNGQIKVAGRIADPTLSGTLKINQARLYQQPVSGSFIFSLKKNLLTAEADLKGLYDAAYQAKIVLNLSEKEPRLDLAASFTSLNLYALAEKTPGIEGSANGNLKMSGPFNQLTGSLNSSLSRAKVFGQPLQNLNAAFSWREGDFFLDDFRAYSQSALITAQGKIDRELRCDFQADASGLRIAGKGVLGHMEALINKFTGRIRWKLDEKFLTSPLKNIYASGEAVLSEGQIGEQRFDRAAGRIELGDGLIRINNASLQKASSSLEASGQTGIGHPTQLTISGQDVALEDMKILNHLLPAELQNPAGKIDLEVNISGLISAETRITSLDPLLDLSAQGRCRLRDGKIAEIPFRKIELTFGWKDHNLSLSARPLELIASSFNFDFNYNHDDTIAAKIDGTADLAIFRSLTKSYGKLSGMMGLSLQMQGSRQNPELAASFWVNDFSFDELYFKSVEGSLSYDRNRVFSLRSLLLKNENEKYNCSGQTTLATEDFSRSDLRGSLKIEQTDLGAAYRLATKLQQKVALFFSNEPKQRFIIPANLRLPSLQPFMKNGAVKLYFSNGEKNFFLKRWNNFYRQIAATVTEAPAENLGGKLSGTFSLNGKINNLSGKFQADIRQGYFRNFSFDKFAAEVSLDNREFKIQKAVLSKGEGSIKVQGSYNLDQSLFLNFIANAMPLDILQLLSPNSQFKGAFNLNAAIDGTLSRPRFVLAAAGNDLTLAGTHFDKITLAFSHKDQQLYLQEFSLLEGKDLSQVYGNFSFARSGTIELEAALNGNGIGLINLLSDEIKWEKGMASLSLKISGNRRHPQINGSIELSDNTFSLPSLASKIKQLNLQGKINNNLLTVEVLTGFWTGLRTRNYPNPIGLTGTIDLKNALAENGQLYLNLSASPAVFYLAFPNLYTGNLTINQLYLQGPFSFDWSRGPLLKGELEINNAVINLPEGGIATAPSGKPFPLNLDLYAKLTKNTYAVMGDIATLNLSNVFMNLEIRSDELKISGPLQNPQLSGKIAIRRGTVNIFNREFSLLSTDNQQKYFPYDPDQIKDNIALFSNEEGKAGSLPAITLTAAVNVDSLEKGEGGLPVKKKVIVLARLEGIPGAKVKEEALNIKLYGYTEDKTRTPPGLVAAAYNEQELRVLLLPDFIKSLTGISQGGETSGVDTNLILADYLSSRVQTILFRGIEREAEQRLGLESLTLEYNLGPKVREAMGVKETRGFEEEKPAWSVGFVKGFFDRLYVDVRYSQAMQQTGSSSQQNTFNYQLTYKISPIWSIIYYREPISLNEITTGYQKVTLKAGFALW